MPRRALHIVNGEHFAGAERVQDLLALNLPKFGYEVGFVTLKIGQFIEERASWRCPVYQLPMRGRTDVSAARTIAAIIRHGHYDIVHTHTPRTAFVGRIASFLSETPMIHHVHGPTYLDTEQRWRNYRNVVIERMSLIGVSRCIPVSTYAHSYAHAIGVPHRKLCVVRNGVPTPEKPRVTDAGGPLSIGTAALFRPKKGIEVLIDAFYDVTTHSPHPVVLTMIGKFESAEYEQTIHNRARKLGIYDRINWIGFTSEVYSHIRRLSVFVLPSLYGEGLPMVILEAMALGLPIVASRVAGIEDAIQDGVHGVLVPPRDTCALSSALVAILNGGINTSDLCRNAKARQIDVFSDVAMAKGVAHVYDEVLVARKDSELLRKRQ